MRSAVEITQHSERLPALCDLWKAGAHEVWITLEGGSMQPTLPPGSRLRIRCGQTRPQLGDVVAFCRNGELVIHRLIGTESAGAAEPTAYLFRGDANPVPDPPVTAEQLVGVVVETRLPSWQTRCLNGLRHRLRHWPQALRLSTSVRRGIRPGVPKL
jgi:signal peptidase I